MLCIIITTNVSEKMNNVKIGEIRILYGIYFAELLSLELLSFAKYYFKLIHFCGVLFSLTLAYFSFVHADLVSRIVSANSEVFFFFYFMKYFCLYICGCISFSRIMKPNLLRNRDLGNLSISTICQSRLFLFQDAAPVL